MRRIHVALSLLALFVTITASPALAVAPGHSFFFTYGGSGDEAHTIGLYAGISSARSYVSITSSGSEYSISGSDVYVIYIDDNGGFSGGYTYDLGGDERAYAALFYGNTTYIVGEIKHLESDSDGFIMALNASLTPIWAFIVDTGNDDRLTDLAMDVGGNIIAVGTASNYSNTDYGDTIILNVSQWGSLYWVYLVYTQYPTEARGIETLPGSTEFTIVGARYMPDERSGGYIEYVSGGGSISIMWDVSISVNYTSIELNDVTFNPNDGNLYAVGVINDERTGTSDDIYVHVYNGGNQSILGQAFGLNDTEHGVHIMYSKHYSAVMGTGTTYSVGMGYGDQFLLNMSKINSSYSFFTLGTNDTDTGVWVDSVEDPYHTPGIILSGDTYGVPVSGGSEAYVSYINDTDKHGITFTPINKSFIEWDMETRLYGPAAYEYGYNYVLINASPATVNYEFIEPSWEIEPIPEPWLVMVLPLAVAVAAAATYMWLRRRL